MGAMVDDRVILKVQPCGLQPSVRKTLLRNLLFGLCYITLSPADSQRRSLERGQISLPKSRGREQIGRMCCVCASRARRDGT